MRYGKNQKKVRRSIQNTGSRGHHQRGRGDRSVVPRAAALQDSCGALGEPVSGRDAGGGYGPSRERELERTVEKLQAKVGEMTMTIDFLKKAAAWKQRQKNEVSSVISGLNWAPSKPPATPQGSPSQATTTVRRVTR